MDKQDIGIIVLGVIILVVIICVLLIFGYSNKDLEYSNESVLPTVNDSIRTEVPIIVKDKITNEDIETDYVMPTIEDIMNLYNDSDTESVDGEEETTSGFTDDYTRPFVDGSPRYFSLVDAFNDSEPTVTVTQMVEPDNHIASMGSTIAGSVNTYAKLLDKTVIDLEPLDMQILGISDYLISTYYTEVDGKFTGNRKDKDTIDTLLKYVEVYPTFRYEGLYGDTVKLGEYLKELTYNMSVATFGD